MRNRSDQLLVALMNAVAVQAVNAARRTPFAGPLNPDAQAALAALWRERPKVTRYLPALALCRAIDRARGGASGNPVRLRPRR